MCSFGRDMVLRSEEREVACDGVRFTFPSVSDAEGMMSSSVSAAAKC